MVCRIQSQMMGPVARTTEARPCRNGPLQTRCYSAPVPKCPPNKPQAVGRNRQARDVAKGEVDDAELARRIGRDRERLRGSFRALVERGLAVADSDDPEQARWSVTPAGRLMLDRLGEARREGITELLRTGRPSCTPTSCG